MEKQLSELVEKLKQAAGLNLRSVVLYGSAVAGDFHPQHSNLNVLCLLSSVGGEELRKLRPVGRWWEAKGHPAPLVFTLDELQRAADVFAIELLDLQESHRTLFGDDFLATLRVPLELHPLQVKRELRHNLVRLRERYLAAPASSRSLLALMTGSISSFAVLFRHALRALDNPAAEGTALAKREVFERLGRLLQFDPTPFEAVLDVREGARVARSVDAEKTFESYLEGVTRVTEEVDRRLNH